MRGRKVLDMLEIIARVVGKVEYTEKNWCNHALPSTNKAFVHACTLSWAYRCHSIPVSPADLP